MNGGSSNRSMAHYSFVVPIYNDGHLAESFCDVFSSVMKSYLGREDIESAVELIFVNDGSTDDSQDRLTTLSRTRKFVRIVEFSRNFGHHIAVSCGYGLAAGDFVGLINVDMQDPPDQIPLLLDYLRNSDCDLVIGSRPARKDGFIARIGSRAFFVTMNFLTKSRRPTNLAVLRVMTRRFVDAYNRFSEHRPYVNGLEGVARIQRGLCSHRPSAAGEREVQLYAAQEVFSRVRCDFEFFGFAAEANRWLRFSVQHRGIRPVFVPHRRQDIEQRLSTRLYRHDFRGCVFGRRSDSLDRAAESLHRKNFTGCEKQASICH